MTHRVDCAAQAAQVLPWQSTEQTEMGDVRATWQVDMSVSAAYLKAKGEVDRELPALKEGGHRCAVAKSLQPHGSR